MTDQNNTAPAVWDPTARGGAGGWVRGGQGGQPQPEGGGAPPQSGPQPPQPHPVPPRPVQPQPGQAQPVQPPVHPQQQPGSAGDQGPPLAPRPYLAASPGFDADRTRTAPAVPQAPPGGYGYPQQPGQGFPSHTAPRPPAGPPPGQYPQHPHPQEAYPQGAYPQADGGSPEYAGYEEIGRYDDEPPRRNRTPLFVALGLLAVLGLGAGVVLAVQNSNGDKGKQAGPAPAVSTAAGQQPAPLPGGSAAAPVSPTAAASPTAGPSASPSAGANAQAQAQALDELLTRGEGAKAPIGSAVAKVSSCPAKADIESAAQVFDAGATQRDQLLGDLAKLDLADVPGGSDAVQSLKSAWQQSADIDRAYATWARTVISQGCSGSNAPTTADKKRADELNPQATQSKKDFVAKWNTLAGSYGLAARTWDRI